MTLDDRIAWAHYEFTDELMNGETVEEWISLSGKQGDDKEGVINVIFSFSVGYMCLLTILHVLGHTQLIKWNSQPIVTSLMLNLNCWALLKPVDRCIDYHV